MSQECFVCTVINALTNKSINGIMNKRFVYSFAQFPMYSLKRSSLFVLGLIGSLLLAPQAVFAAKATYSIATVGSAADVTTPTTEGLALMGGAVDVDSAFQFLVNRSGGGDVVVLCVGCNTAYNKYINRLGKVDSVETISFKSRDASYDPLVVSKIRNAEALFIAGGDQTNYMNFWKDTPVEDAINSLVARQVPIGGTSAGLAILGEYVFTAANGTITSPTALANPYDPLVVLDRNFLALPRMNSLITDSHFVARDRMGRLMTFLARISQDGWTTAPRAIGVDEGGAVLIDEHGTASFVGTGTAYFLKTPATPAVCTAGTPLTYTGVSAYKIQSGAGVFHLDTWTGEQGVSYTLSAQNGVLSSTQSGGAIY